MMAPLSLRRDVLRAVVERMIPEDDLPSGWRAGVGDFIDRMLRRTDVGWGDELARGLESLDAEAGGFAEMNPADQDAILRRLEGGKSRTSWFVDPAEFVRLVSGLCAQAYYGEARANTDDADAPWRSLGYSILPAGRSWPVPEPAAGPAITVDRLRSNYDCIVVGAGPGGGIAAQVLSEAGMTVLLVERGASLSSDDLPLDLLRSERSSTGYPTRTGPSPSGDPRVLVSGAEDLVVHAPDPRWSANAFTVGGGSRVYGAQAWRFAPTDFRMASTYGTPEGSSLADWPIGYDDIEPWYDRCEWEYGVSGDSEGVRFAGPRRRGYPMPPLPDTLATSTLRRGAAALGLSTSSVPLLINSVPFDGRAACVRCGACVGFACQAGAKNGAHNTAIPRALRTGRCDLLPLVQADRLLMDDNGTVCGVSLTEIAAGGGQRTSVHARRVVVAAGAIETARLLLNSTGPRAPHGIGNNHDMVGRNLQAHVYAGAIGFFDDVVQDSLGPGPNIATNDFRHGNAGVIGGGMIANDFVPTPLNVWDTLSRLGVIPRWGIETKQGMRRLWPRMLMVFGPVQEVPNPEARIGIDPGVVDRFGVPVARLSGDIRPEDHRAASLLADRAAHWLAASGAERVVRMDAADRPAGPSGGQHQAGTCRMGTDPVSSVTDPWGRVWGHPNLLIADGSVNVTNGGVNPVLTIMALAYRNSTRFAEELPAGAAPQDMA